MTSSKFPETKFVIFFFFFQFFCFVNIRLRARFERDSLNLLIRDFDGWGSEADDACKSKKETLVKQMREVLFSF